ncbi:MAG: hypothetical protein RL616_2448 [Verrucomicrobiota bacterium]|jgi:hypothetical protein
MIRSLRQRHRRIAIVLGMFLSVAFAVGLAARKPMPLEKELPAAFTAPRQFEKVGWQRADLFAKSPVQVRLLRGKNGAGKFAAALSAANDFTKPDLLVYWVSGNPNLTNTLPDNAILLGVFNSPALPLPDAAAESSGVLVLYGLADNEIVDVSKAIRFNDSTE